MSPVDRQLLIETVIARSDRILELQARVRELEAELEQTRAELYTARAACGLGPPL